MLKNLLTNPPTGSSVRLGVSSRQRLHSCGWGEGSSSGTQASTDVNASWRYKSILQNPWFWKIRPLVPEIRYPYPLNNMWCHLAPCPSMLFHVHWNIWYPYPLYYAIWLRVLPWYFKSIKLYSNNIRYPSCRSLAAQFCWSSVASCQISLAAIQFLKNISLLVRRSLHGNVWSSLLVAVGSRKIHMPPTQYFLTYAIVATGRP